MMKFIFLLLIALINGGLSVSNDGIADCSEGKQASIRKLLSRTDCYIVSTLDGKVTALDVNDNGRVLWSYSTDDDGLLQSTIGNFQFVSDAIYFKLVPALDGSLYKLNQQYNIIEPVPLNADILLKSSFKLGDDLLINGGKEVKTFAFDLASGDLIYSCGLADCANTRGARNDDSNLTIVLIRQLRQKVKAVDPRSGAEQWKFSVGENNAQLLGKPDDCHLLDNADQPDNGRQNEKLYLSIADGLIRMENRQEKRLLWTQKLESPIVGMWLYQNGKLGNVDLFKHDLTATDSVSKKPILYIGSHKNQFYIQHSNAIKEKYREIGRSSYSFNNHLYSPQQPFVPLLDWTSDDLVVDGSQETNNLQVVPSSSRALSIPTQGQFIFLKPQTPNPRQCYPPSVDENLTANQPSEDYFNGTRAPSDSIEQIIIISLWHWWKEVAFISIFLAVLINFIYSYFRKHVIHKVFPTCPVEEDQLCRVHRSPKSSECQDDTKSTSTNPPTPTLPLPSNQTQQSQPAQRPNSLPSSFESTNNYVSRYITDFEPICCLGKGGFGVVFQARNRIDDCHYAVKRINLPIQQNARDKVMREVRALACLEHHGIVRYYNSWLEAPPEGWQKEADAGLITEKSSYWGSDPGSTSLKSDSAIAAVSSNSSYPAEVAHQPWPSVLNRTNKLDFDVRKNETGDGDDSYIVFQHSASSSAPNLRGKNNNNNNATSGINNSDDTSNNKDNHLHPNGGDDDDDEQSNCQQGLDETSADDEKGKHDLITRKQLNQRQAYLYIQMQLCQKETLREWLKTHKDRETTIILEYFAQIVEAVDYVHSKKLMHRDLKPSNIFFAMDGCVKIGDFGLVTGIVTDNLGAPGEGISVGGGGDTPVIETAHGVRGKNNKGRHTDQVGTKLYMSPEQIAGSSYSNKVDIYSLGVIFFEMLMPFDTEMERIKTLSSIKEGVFPPKFENNRTKECRLICKLLSCDPEERPLASEILEDPIFYSAANELIIERIPRKRTLSSSNGH